jgi:hypothetical protein
LPCGLANFALSHGVATVLLGFIWLAAAAAWLSNDPIWLKMYLS